MAENKIRLYRATAEVDAIFVLPDGVRAELAASDYLAQEVEANGLMSKKFRTEELTDIRQVPKSWMGVNVWGAEEAGLPDELTPEMFFDKSQNRVILAEIERHQRAIDDLKKKMSEATNG